MLYLIATPIGNLKDITLRSLEILQSCDGVICEDTRRTGQLLNHYQIKRPMLVLNDFNESRSYLQIIDRLKNGENLCLVSDAGTPLVSDPGFKLVRECIQSKLEIDSLPGPSSVITALTLSGLPPDKFSFLGYPPEKSGHRAKFFQNILTQETQSDFKSTYIVFVSPHKLLRNLAEIQGIFGNIEVVLAHELTKIHQSVEKKLVSTWLEDLKTPKGEYILLFRL